MGCGKGNKIRRWAFVPAKQQSAARHGVLEHKIVSRVSLRTLLPPQLESKKPAQELATTGAASNKQTTKKINIQSLRCAFVRISRGSDRRPYGVGSNPQKKAICSFGAPSFCRYNCINTQHRAGAMIQRIRFTYGVRLPIKIIFGLGGLVFDRVICRFGTQNRRVLKLQITKRKRHKRWLKIQTKSTLRSQKKATIGDCNNRYTLP